MIFPPVRNVIGSRGKRHELLLFYADHIRAANARSSRPITSP
jgi:hypothetical protein